jgi:drug/metabolite transporter (DMT)-like permease
MPSALPAALTTAATIVALLLAAWALLAAALGRPPDKVQLIGTGLVTLGIVVLVVSVIPRWEPADPVTFVGYAVTALLLPPAAWVLARLEPTRYGSLIVGVAALIMPVLILRMGQVWVAS